MEPPSHRPPLDAPDVAGTDDGVGVLRAALHAAEEDCYGLYPLLPHPERWDGVARRAFDEQLAALRRRIDRAVAALREAGCAL